MDKIWTELNEMGGAARLDTKDYEAVLYQGLKVVKDEDGLTFLSTENDFYPAVKPSIVEIFYSEGLEAGMKAYKRDKYYRQLEEFGASSRMAKGLNRKLMEL